MTTQSTGSFPLTFDVEYPEQGLSRLTTLLRIPFSIPLYILDIFLAATVTLPLVALLLLRQKYPRWWFDYNLERSRFAARVSAYTSLLTDRYPSTDDAQSVRLDFDYPNAAELNRFLPLIKWLLAIPHYIILAVLWAVLIVVTLVAWLAILFTGNYPRGLFDFVVGVERWNWRVRAYTSLLITDQYPPFSMS